MKEEFPKPIVVVSKCLGFAHCRYDGQMLENPLVSKLQKYVELQPVCPEMEIGLGVPRNPIRIVEIDGKQTLYQPATGKDVTENMRGFAETFLNALTDVDGFLLKNRSPSCGPDDVKVYPGLGNVSRTLRGSGMFAGAVLKKFAGLPMEDEGRLRNFTIRENFLTKLFMFARFRAVKAQNTIHALVEFHTYNKLLLMGYNQHQMRLMGKIVANHDNAPIEEVIHAYETHLKLATAAIPRFPSIINVLLHAFGGFSNDLSHEEKQFFLNSVEEYRDERIPLSALLHVLRAWSLQFHNDYLLEQTFMTPYPKELVEITDSGKGRDL